MVRSNDGVIDRLIEDAARGRLSRRDLARRAAAAGLAAPAIALLLRSTPGAAAQGSPAAGAAVEPTGKVVLAMTVEPDTLENWRAYSTDGHPVIRNVQEALLNRDPVTNELVGELATAWEQTDEVTWRFTLREGVTFHNGDPFNAEVAAFGINYTWSPENNFQIYQYVGPDMTATAVDEYTVDVVTEAPDPILPSRLYFSPIPNMIQVQERPETLPDQPIGTGPYRFVEWNRGQYIRLAANPDWWGNTADDAHGAVSINEVEYVFRPESAVRAAMVATGEAQLGRFLSPEDCQTTPKCETASSVETIFLRLDTMHPAMADPRIRQAIGLAIDKQGVADQLFGGGEAASQLVGPSATGYNEELEPYPYDLEQARALVAEAAADGVAVDAPIRVVTRQGIYLRNDEFAQYVATQLSDIGLTATSEVIEIAQYNEQYDINYADVPEDRGWIGTNPHGNEIMDVSSTARAYYSCEGGSSTYCNPALDEALNAAIPLTGDERAAALAEVTRMYYEDYGSIPILHMPLNYGLAANLEWTPRLDGFMLVKEMSYS
ncbi:MAG: ABC transporter, substrate-binding protein (cluster 5, nickel/peptides/opines) [uncultured Thermomicrobiales bacterium]|uniref:ABC transporter, substrate-binding protein (Cluster 5, nickel/peptides/opines) n=1 Tax=uncultured Thermomicrobiales bacterium TaxID=1645740 RepID=A0A6J4UL62_9BACT|nr:MAG: ABC transporter, substrate-binding protein (cluster 5, nickel/peptides/opines) [uncultured Thermomicrobiales bacterium]